MHVLFGHTCLLKDIRALEAIKKRVSRLSPNLAHLAYYKRSRMDRIMTYKILHGLVDIPVEEFFQHNTSHIRSNDQNPC